jgi:serine/threonine protein kinase
MATVYRAKHILLKQERALKVMSPELTSQPGFKESFLREG